MANLNCKMYLALINAFWQHVNLIFRGEFQTHLLPMLPTNPNNLVTNIVEMWLFLSLELVQHKGKGKGTKF